MAESFVVAEEEQFVFRDRTAEGAAKLISAERSDIALIEEIPGIERAVAEEFKNGSVEPIAAGLSDDRDLRAGSLAVFGRVGSAQDIELPHGIDTEKIS